MGFRLTIDRVPKSLVSGDVILNRDSDIAFDTHIDNDLESWTFNKGSLVANAIILYREKHDTEPEGNYSEFSLFSTKDFIDAMLEYALGDFEKDYTSQEGYFEIHTEQRVWLINDVELIKEFVENTDLDAHYLIITHM